MPIWYIEVLDDRTLTWELAEVETDAGTARAVRDELEADGFAVRARERKDLLAAEAARLDSADGSRTLEQRERWIRYQVRARLRPQNKKR